MVFSLRRQLRGGPRVSRVRAKNSTDVSTNFRISQIAEVWMYDGCEVLQIQQTIKHPIIWAMSGHSRLKSSFVSSRFPRMRPRSRFPTLLVQRKFFQVTDSTDERPFHVSS